MTVTVQDRVAELEAEAASLRLVIQNLNESEWARVRSRFHGFDAIRNDACPACGGRVAVQYDAVAHDGEPEGVKLIAIGREHVEEAWAEARRLREATVEALRQMQAGRRTVAISTLKAVLSGETW